MDIRKSARELRDRLHRILHSPAGELDRGGRFLSYQIRLWLFCGRKLVKDRLQVTASALSYKTLLSLIPVLALFSLILTMIPETDIRQKIRDTVFEAAGLKEIDIDEMAPPPDEVEPADGPVQGTTGEAAEDADSVADQLTAMVDRVVGDIRGGKGSITVISVVLFIWAGMSIFKTVEGAFNYIWEVRRGRSLFSRFRDFLTSIVLFGLLLGVAIWSMQYERIGEFFAGVSGVVPLLSTWLLFFAVYKLVPTVRVHTKAAFTAAVVAGSLWELGAKSGFALYLRHTTGQLQLYGMLALIPIFMIWIWLSWIIVLFGAELAYVIQHMRGLTQSLLESGKRARYLRPDLASLAVATAIAQRFADGGEPPTRRELADLTGASQGDVGEILQALQSAGLLRDTPRGDQRAGYVPAKPLEAITAQQVVEAGAAVELSPSADDGGGAMLKWARQYMDEISPQARSTLAADNLATLARRVAEK